MSIKIVIPEYIKEGFYKRFKIFGLSCAIGINAHTLQCDQRWLFLIRIGCKRFGYRTYGDATPNMMTYEDGGWHFPWNKGFEDIPYRTVSGRG